jgi:hypothetical protein
MLRLSNFLENRLRDDGEVISLMCQTPFIPRKISGAHLFYRVSGLKDHIAAGRIRSTENSSEIGN